MVNIHDLLLFLLKKPPAVADHLTFLSTVLCRGRTSVWDRRPKPVYGAHGEPDGAGRRRRTRDVPLCHSGKFRCCFFCNTPGKLIRCVHVQYENYKHTWQLISRLSARFQLALTHSPPLSEIFVFTDASPKDAHLFDAVKALALEKQSKVSFHFKENCSL